MKKGLFDGVKASVERLLSQGYPLIGVLNQLHDDVIERDDLTDTDKALICEKLGEVLFCHSIEKLTLTSFAAGRACVHSVGEKPGGWRCRGAADARRGGVHLPSLHRAGLRIAGSDARTGCGENWMLAACLIVETETSILYFYFIYYMIVLL